VYTIYKGCKGVILSAPTFVNLENKQISSMGGHEFVFLPIHLVFQFLFIHDETRVERKGTQVVKV
jgi:hypothetical protein